jgi:hypothetical protein
MTRRQVADNRRQPQTTADNDASASRKAQQQVNSNHDDESSPFLPRGKAKDAGSADKLQTTADNRRQPQTMMQAQAERHNNKSTAIMMMKAHLSCLAARRKTLATSGLSGADGRKHYEREKRESKRAREQESRRRL